ncbi:hypothetical protein ACFV1W_25300 [Kitasatospora sp. NPDC059648]|uniref:hypothetical protein n=1 Tax=Kitasatospora sp. NPDC059648 TaxID=3346894 RepID=UPI0036B62ACD
MLTVAEMRRRRRELAAVDGRVKDALDVLLVNTRKAAAEAATALTTAETAADETLALAAKVHGSAKAAANLTGLPLSEVERAVKVVPAKRVKALQEELQTKAEAKVAAGSSRRRTPKPSADSGDAPPAASGDTTGEDGSKVGGASVPGQVSTGPVAAADQSAASVS